MSSGLKTLSVIIVSYNVKYFLFQTLQSLYKALEGIESEVFVVDNNSADDTVSYIQNHFPEVNFIANKENLGFSKANNQAFKLSDSKFVLLLNPDTVLKEDTLKICIQEIENNQKIGALGVKMIDGKGNFLPESKRGLPTPWVSLCKISGLISLFPHSKLFSQYYLGHLPENEKNNIEVLTGAFMFVRSDLYRAVGMLDETYFMYGEDIDFSYQITQKGYDIAYLPNTQILHYKGESTKKKSLKFIKSFHDAMIIFYHKNFKKGKYGFARVLIEFIIDTKAFIERLKLNFPTPQLKPKSLKTRKNWVLVSEKESVETSEIVDFLQTNTEVKHIPVLNLQEMKQFLTNQPIKAEGLNIVFDLNRLSFGTCIDLMQQFKNKDINFWNATPNGTLLGSHSKNENGEIFVMRDFANV